VVLPWAQLRRGQVPVVLHEGAGGLVAEGRGVQEGKLVQMRVFLA
jgi:hypothetical protein